LDEPWPAEGTLTLAEAIRRAATTHPDIQAALARVRMALADARQARLLPNPLLNLALRWPEGGGSPIIEASLAQDLISILQVPRKSSAADNRLRQSASDALTVALDVAAEVQERYATVQALDELMPVLEQRRALLGKVVDLAHARLTGGEGTREDLTVLEAQRVELEVEIAESDQQRRDERLRLARLIGEPSGAAVWALDPWVAPPVATASESAWLEAALANRPEIQSVAWELAALGDERVLAGFLPWEGTSAGVDAERDDGWSVGPEVSVPLPIFDMGQARRARVSAEQIEARHRLTQASRLAVEEVRRAWESLTRTAANLGRVQQELIPLQQQRRTLAEAAFRLGQRDATSFFLAEQDLRAAQARAVDLERQTTIAIVRLQRAAGGAGVARQLVSRREETP
jgi:outer membrane protein TolC